MTWGQPDRYLGPVPTIYEFPGVAVMGGSDHSHFLSPVLGAGGRDPGVGSGEGGGSLRAPSGRADGRLLPVSPHGPPSVCLCPDPLFS